jgi:AcrR family transcriptional regulator
MMETRDRIQITAAELFMRYGIRSISMDDIAAKLGMSKKTIYQFFADKDELVGAVLDLDICDTQERCDNCLHFSHDAVEEIVLTMEMILEQFRNLNPIILHDLQKFHHTAFQKLTDHKNHYLLDIIRKNLVRGISEGLYRPDIEVEVIARFRLESMMLSFNLDIYPPAKYNLADVSLQIIEHYLFGLATPEGYRLILKYQQERIQKKGKHE